jgi:hypothetical protein
MGTEYDSVRFNGGHGADGLFKRYQMNGTRRYRTWF